MLVQKKGAKCLITIGRALGAIQPFLPGRMLARFG